MDIIKTVISLLIGIAGLVLSGYLFWFMWDNRHGTYYDGADIEMALFFLFLSLVLFLLSGVLTFLFANRLLETI